MPHRPFPAALAAALIWGLAAAAPAQEAGPSPEAQRALETLDQGLRALRSAPLFIEQGTVPVTTTWQAVSFAERLAAPVVIPGPPTADATALIRLRTVSDAGFELRAQAREGEVAGLQTLERVPFVAVASGTWQRADGSLWQAGSLPLTAADGWGQVTFHEEMPQAPYLFAAVQTMHAEVPVSLRIRNVSAQGFEVTLVGDGSGETIGWLAIHDPDRVGEVLDGVAPVFYRLDRVGLGASWQAVAGVELRATAQDGSEPGDAEVHVMSFGDRALAQPVTAEEAAPLLLRQR